MTAVPRPARQSRAVEAQQGVKDLIVRRGLVAGDPLPTESELMEELQVSRNSIREALKALQAVGIVDIRHGFGMFVGRMSLAGLVDELTFHSRITLQNGKNHLAHLVEIREILESGLVQRLIDLGQEADLTPISDVIARMESEADEGLVSPETDRLFHDLLYRPLGNPLVSQLLGAFWDVYYQLRDHLGEPDEPPLDVAKRHRDMYTAVLAGDRAAAEAAVHAHFHGVRNRLARLRG
ncbi:FadR family transcriptional regulator [Nonomuraea sp. K274]|uniref:FadR family transcriptional regulator n=1 Tax=Nonomuraea cypriaca TaxID=1187855 RepID=A0A931AC68_9ACTN|nr:FCD domain-containing protein [Nonomuraea cypriaca]MBF8186632.1 FadR family transcriptional regulator [Nonomuraea cypriaca]